MSSEEEKRATGQEQPAPTERRSTLPASGIGDDRQVMDHSTELVPVRIGNASNPLACWSGAPALSASWTRQFDDVASVVSRVAPNYQLQALSRSITAAVRPLVSADVARTSALNRLVFPVLGEMVQRQSSYLNMVGSITAAAVGRSLLIDRSVVSGLTELAQRQSPLVKSLTSGLSGMIRPLQDSLATMLKALIRHCTRVVHAGIGLARLWARLAVMAALGARDAVLHGRVEEVDAFMEKYLGLRPTPWRREALAMVLLDDQWIPANPAEASLCVLGQIKTLTSKEARNHKLLGETQLCGRAVTTLNAPVTPTGDGYASLVELVADPATRDGVPVDLGFADPRIGRVLARLSPEERRVALAYGDGSGETWATAAIAAGLPSELGERVRRKCKRLARQLGGVHASLQAQSGRASEERG